VLGRVAGDVERTVVSMLSRLTADDVGASTRRNEERSRAYEWPSSEWASIDAPQYR
jgi:hypothetical protein